MKKVFKITAVVVLGLIATLAIVTIGEQLFQEDIPLSTAPDFDFVAWSNTVSTEKAEIQLKKFINNNFESWNETEEWLEKQGFEVKNPVAYWSTEKGVIFADGWLNYWESKTFVYGTSVYLSYNEKPFIINQIVISKSRL